MKDKKQIEEMAADIHSLIRSDAISRALASLLCDKGYCKASEVAREIFAEIDRMIYCLLNDRHYIVGDMCYEVEELKKKYIGEDTNVRTNTED